MKASYLQKHQSTRKTTFFGPNRTQYLASAKGCTIHHEIFMNLIQYRQKSEKRPISNAQMFEILHIELYNMILQECYIDQIFKNHAKPRSTIFCSNQCPLRNSMTRITSNTDKILRLWFYSSFFVKPILELFLFERHERIYHVNIASGYISLYLFVPTFLAGVAFWWTHQWRIFRRNSLQELSIFPISNFLREIAHFR